MQMLEYSNIAPHDMEEKIDLRRYWNVISRRKWQIMAGTLLTTVAVGAILFIMSPMYRATATVMVESKEANVVSIQDVYDADTRDEKYFQTQFEILKSPALADNVIDRLHLGGSDEFQKYAAPSRLAKWLPFLAGPDVNSAAAQRERYEDHYEDLLNIEPIRNTQLVDVSFDSHDPQQAMDVANAHAKAYIESHLEAKAQMARTALEWMSSRLKELKARLAKAEVQQQAYVSREQLVDVNGIQSLSAHELTELSNKLVEARKELSQAKNSYDQIQQVRNASIEDKLSIPAINADPLVQKFHQAKAEADLNVAQLSRRYGPLNPKMIAAVSAREAAQKALKHQVDSVLNSIRNEYLALNGQVKALESAMDAAKSSVRDLGRKDSEYQTLTRDVDTSRELYDLFYKRLSETREAADLVTPNARVISPATLPAKPVKPRKLLILVLVFVGSLIMFVLLAFLADMLNNTLRHGNDVKDKLELTLLGMVPQLKFKRKEQERVYTEFGRREKPEFVEAVRSVRTAVTLGTVEKGQKIIMVASSLGDEGKSTVACNMAMAFARSERVLLIDADLRCPSLASVFGLSEQQAGLAEVLAGTATIKDCVVRDGERRLDIIASSIVPANPQELLGSRNLPLLLQKLKDHYDRVIIDCSPLLVVSDGLLLAGAVDAIVYVVKAESTTVNQVTTGLQLLGRNQRAVMGVVLNGVDTSRLASYGEYGGGYFYGPYGTPTTG